MKNSQLPTHNIANKGFSGMRKFVSRFNFSCTVIGNRPQSLTGHIVNRYGQPCQPGKWQVFRSFGRTFSISSGHFFAEDSSSFDSLSLEKKNKKKLADSFAGLDREFFISTETFKKLLGRQFLSVRQFVFHFDDDFRVRLDKILRIKN